MNPIIKIFLVLILSSGFAGSVAHANSPSYAAFQEIQGEIAKLMQENQLLKKQYEILNREYEALLAEYKMENREAERLNSLAKRRIDSEEKGQSSVGALQREVERIQGDIMLKETKSRHMEREMIDMEERQKLWKLKVADLEYEKQQLELEYKRKELLTQGKKSQQDVVTLDLKQTLVEKLQEEEAIRAQMKMLHEHGGNSTQYLRQLREENESLKREIEERQRERKAKAEELSLKKSRIAPEPQAAGPGAELTREGQAKLQAEVHALEKEYAYLNQKIEDSIAEQSKRKDMLQQVITMDQENQDLRAKITQLTQQIDYLGQ